MREQEQLHTNNHAIELEQRVRRRWRVRHGHKKYHGLWLELHALQRLVQLQHGLQEQQLLHELNFFFIFFYEFYTHKRLVLIYSYSYCLHIGITSS